MSISNKCPACRSPLPAMASKCEACGTELQTDEANKSVLSIAERFKEIEAELRESGLKGSSLNAELKSRRSREIRDFPVPNSRNALISLLHYIAPRLDSANADPNIDDWRAKFREVSALAKNSFKGDAKARAEVEEIERSVQVSMAGELKNRAKRSPLIASIVAVVTVAVLGGLISVQMQKRKLAACEEKYEGDALAEIARLDGVASTVAKELKEQKFSDAMSTISGMRWNVLPDCKKEAASTMAMQWDQKREELTSLIEVEGARFAAEKQAAEDRLAAERQAAERRLMAEKIAAQQRAAAKEAAAARKAATAARNAATNREF